MNPDIIAHPRTSWGDPLVILAIVNAVAVAAYFVTTIFLWVSTNRAANAASVSADAAKTSADATVKAAEQSKRSADLLAALNRPYMGVHRVAFKSGPNAMNDPAWTVVWEIRNYGMLPALAVEARVDFCLNATIQFAGDGPHSAEIFSQADPVSTVTIFPFEGQRRNEVMSGTVTLVARINIACKSPDGQRFNHRADARFNRGHGTFSVINSETVIL